MWNLLNFLMFQVGWFANVLGVAKRRRYLGMLVTVPLVAFHLWSFEEPVPELLFLCTALILGATVDTALMVTKVLDYGDRGRLQRLICPLWIMNLWILFGTTFHRSLAWLADNPWLAALLGGLGGATSYLAGQRLGAVKFPMTRGRTLLILAVVWALVMPLLGWLSLRPIFLPAVIDR